MSRRAQLQIAPYITFKKMLHGLLIIFFITLAGSAFIEDITQNITSNITTTDQNHKPLQPECLGPPKYYEDRPRFIDCGRIIDKLPQSPELADFHDQGEDDEYKLPWVVESATCQVRVEINKYWVADVDSWMGVKLAAVDLNTVCRSYSKVPRTGGSTVTGNGGRIKITIKKNPYNGIDKDATASTLDPSANNISTE